MNRKRFSRVGSALIGATLLLSALVPAATAAPPKWDMTVTQLVPGGVSVGSEQGFDIVITNNGNSNISSLYLFDTVGDNTVYVTDSRGLCNAAGGPLYCNFGALRSKETVTARVAYAFPTSKGDGNITFEINTTGVVLGGNNSHGDAKLVPQTVNLLAADSDRAGRWVTTPGYNVANNQALSATNLQATKVTGLGQYIPVTVQDGSGVSFSCPKSLCKSKPFGQWSDVSVAGGAPFATPFAVTLTIAKSALPASVSLSKVVVYHVNGSTVEVIGLACSSVPPAAGDPECRTAALDAGGNLVITVYVYRNGGFRGAA